MSGSETVRARIESLGHALPVAARPAGAYVPAVMVDGFVYTSGQLPMRDGALMTTGLVDEEVSLEEARECAVRCVLNCLAAAETVCDLDSMARVVKLVGYVASTDGFVSQPTVIDAASEFLTSVFGADGAHAREAVGVKALPLGSPVEISLVLSTRSN